MLLRSTWWLIIGWLALCLLGELYFALQWLDDRADTRRNEALIGIAMAAFYAWPAIVALGLVYWKWRDITPRLESRIVTVVVGAGLVLYVAALAISSMA